MRVLLVRPVGDVTVIDIVGPDLGLGLLTASAKRAGWDARLLDCHSRGLLLEQFADEVARFLPDVVGFKAYTNDVDSINRSAAVVRRLAPEALVVVGGPLPSAFGVGCVPWFRDIDFFFKGEADFSFPAFLKLVAETRRRSTAIPPTDTTHCFRVECTLPSPLPLPLPLTSPSPSPEYPPPVTVTGARPLPRPADLARIPGLMWKDGDGGWVLNDQDFPADLDAVGLPDWSAYDFSRLPIWSVRCPAPYVPLQTSRGCPYNCRFCSAGRISGRKTRRRSVDSVLAEIAHFRDVLGVRHFSVIDDNFLGDRPFIEELLSRLPKEVPGMRWECSSNAIRLNQVDPEILSLLERAGCYNVALGIESGSDRVLKMLNKSLDTRQIEHYVQMIKDTTSIKMHGFFILGLPGETEAEMRQTIEFATHLPIHTANFFLYSPHPGTAAWEALAREGRIDEAAPPAHSLYELPSAVATGEQGLATRKLLLSAYLRFYLVPWRFRHFLKLLNTRASYRKALDVLLRTTLGPFRAGTVQQAVDRGGVRSAPSHRVTTCRDDSCGGARRPCSP